MWSKARVVGRAVRGNQRASAASSPAAGKGGVVEAGAVDDGDGAAAGVAVGVAEGGQLLEIRRFQAGFLEEFAAGGVDEVLVGFDKAAGDCPAEWGIAAADEEDGRFRRFGNDHDIGRHDVAAGRGHGASRSRRRPWRGGA